jgi:hypothetical protein
MVASPVQYDRTAQGWRATIVDPSGQSVGRGEGGSRALASQAALRAMRSQEVLHRLDRYRIRGMRPRSRSDRLAGRR